jgi:hypothetical protein
MAFCRTLVIGFLIGIVVTRFVVTVYQSEQGLRQQASKAMEELTFQAPVQVPVQGAVKKEPVVLVEPKTTTEKKVTVVDTTKPFSHATTSTTNTKTIPVAPAEANNAEAKKKEVVVEFERQERVVIATKIHGPNMSFILEQMLCLLTKAYNERMQYDVLIFTSETFSEEEIKVIQAVGAPAKVTLVKDNPGLPTMVNQLEPAARKAKFLKRCNITTPEEIEALNFYTMCDEPGLGPQRLAYTWQCEFRSLHIWKHPALAPYRYMMWMDTDGFCTEVWKRDPVAYMIQNQLAIFFGNFPQGNQKGKEYQDRFQTAFNQSYCGGGLVDGHLVGSSKCGDNSAIKNIHGFFHITDLDFYRSDPVMHWARTLIGDEFLSRRFDDQLAVTAPAAILAPERSWDMYSHDFVLNVVHNNDIDGKKKRPAGGFKTYWKKNGKNFTEAWGVCQVTAAG